MANYQMSPFDAINAAFHGTIDSIVSIVMRDGIRKVIFNEPVTVVYWGDGEKTVVHCQDGDLFDPRTGILLCCAKRLFGNTGRYNDILSEAMAKSNYEAPDGGDSWEAIEEDSRLNPFDYCKKMGYRLSTCESAEAFKANDIYSRCKRLAGAE